MASSSPAERSEALWHRFGMGLSLLCLLHCLALPWLLSILPMVMLATLPEGLRENAWVHAALIAPVLLRGRPGAGQAPLVFAALAALIGGLFAASEAGERGLTVTGSLLLLAAHWYRLKKAHPH